MKKLILLPFLAVLCLGAKAQDSTSLYQQFNECDSIVDIHGTENHFPPGWSCYSVVGQEDWRCITDYGVGNSPCMHINGYTNSADNDDENWLFTPYLNLTEVSGPVYLNYSTSYYYAGDSLHVFASHDYVVGKNPDSSVYHWTELTHSGAMINDTLYYITDSFNVHQSDLNAFKGSPVIIGFRYESTSAASAPSGIGVGSDYLLDSVITSAVSLGPITGVTKVVKEQLPIKVIGMSTSNQIKLEFSADEGNYDLQIFDLVGRKVYDGNISARNGEQSYTINNINFVSGMYIVKLGNESSCGITRAIVQ